MDVEQWRQMGAEKNKQRTRQYAEEIRNNAEARNGNQSGQILGREDKLYRLERHDAKRGEFLSHLHRPDLSPKPPPGRPLPPIAVSRGPSSRVKPTATNSMT